MCVGAVRADADGAAEAPQLGEAVLIEAGKEPRDSELIDSRPALC